MKIKFLLIILLAITSISCDFLSTTKVPNEDNLMKQELEKINWNEVDEYPTVSYCESDSIPDKETKKQCFFQFLTETIQHKISTDTIQMLYPELDTLSIKVTINTDASVKFETLQPTDSISYNVSKIDSILQNRLVNFPTIEPAIKQGVKVKTQFVVPVILKIVE
ncbi:hypothetical protein [Flavobacterium sp.]|uniref:hypothetical protein n=1 Tax=Flavobacterium sp. TaxID=239 RepID=UPI00352943CE